MFFSACLPITVISCLICGLNRDLLPYRVLTLLQNLETSSCCANLGDAQNARADTDKCSVGQCLGCPPVYWLSGEFNPRPLGEWIHGRAKTKKVYIHNLATSIKEAGLVWFVKAIKSDIK